MQSIRVTIRGILESWIFEDDILYLYFSDNNHIEIRFTGLVHVNTFRLDQLIGCQIRYIELNDDYHPLTGYVYGISFDWIRRSENGRIERRRFPRIEVVHEYPIPLEDIIIIKHL